MPENKELDIGISKFTRDKIIEHLKYSFTHDYLEQVDFEKRCNIAINTQNRKDLEALVEDLPEYKEEQKDQQKTSSALSINTGAVKEKSKITSVLGSTTQKGLWKPPKNLDVLVVLGEATIDFTQASFPPGITEIKMTCVLGSVTMIVPQGVTVDAQCISVLGEVNNKSFQIQNERKNNPILRIRGNVVLGELGIRPPKEKLIKRILKKLGLD